MAFLAIFVGLVSLALAKDDSMNKGIGDYSKSSSEYASGFQKYMSSGGQGSAGGKASGNLPEYASQFVPASANSYVERPAANGKADNAKQGGSFDYSTDYSKYMGRGDSVQSTELVSAEDNKGSVVAAPAKSNDKYMKQYAASKDKYMKQYAGDYSKYMKQGGAMSAIHNKSDSNEWRDYFKNKYVPHVHNKSDPKEMRDAYKKKYAGDYSHYATEGKAMQRKRDAAQLDKVAAEESAKGAASKPAIKEQAPAVVAPSKEQAQADVVQKASVQQLPKVASDPSPMLQEASKQKASAARANSLADQETLLVKTRVASMGFPTLLVGVLAIVAVAALALNMHSRSRQQAQVGPDFYMPLV